MAGIRVLDLSRLLPGPLCTWYLRGLGAEIIKVEDPHGGDQLRAVPPLEPDGVGSWFSALNAGKKSITLDLRLPGDRDRFLQLVETADVVVEGFRPGVLARLGLAPETLMARNPRLVVASITGYGQTGPDRGLPGHDIGFAAAAGLLGLGARHEGCPDVPGYPTADTAGGSLTAAFGIVAALFGRERSGEGTHLDISMTEGAMALIAPFVAGAARQGSVPTPGGEVLTGGIGSYNIYPCGDGKLLTIAALEPKFWLALCSAIGEEIEPTETALAALFLTEPRDHWVAHLGDACVVPLLDLDELEAHPQHVARGILARDGSRLRVRQPFSSAQDGVAGPLCLAPHPALGEHTGEVLAKLGELEDP